MKNKFMMAALKEAQKAYQLGEVPVGAVIVLDGKIIARAHNLREKQQSSLAHAETMAIQKACKKIGSWRLENCELYVTLEPCPMCAGAIIQSRIKKVYYGASDSKAGVAGSVFNLFSYPFNHQVELVPMLMEPECRQILQQFFQELRKKDCHK